PITPRGKSRRRPRHERRSWGRHRSVLEAGCDAAGLGRTGTACILRDRAPDGSRQRRGITILPYAAAARGRELIAPISAIIPWRAPRLGPRSRNWPTWSSEEQRDDRRGAWLPVCRLAGHLAGAG